MSTLDHIRNSVANEIELYEEFLRKSLYSENPHISVVLEYVFNNRGKGIRPLLVLLSSAMCRGNQEFNPKRTNLGAMLIEMIHTASLVHDDIVDNAFTRRGKPSVNALWHSRTAVLIGDYIFAKSFAVGMDSQSFDIVSYITKSINQVCEGELIQNEQSQRLEMTREIYLDIIYKKTASLIGTSCGVGAMAAGASMCNIDKLREFGDNIGIAFQIKDDILDYTPSMNTGKPACGDLRERKITLPLLTVLENASPAYHRDLIAKLSDISRTPSNADYLLEAVIAEGGIEASTKIMNTYLDQAIDLLSEYSPSIYRSSLEELCHFIAERES